MEAKPITDIGSLNLERVGRQIGRAIEAKPKEYRDLQDALNAVLGECFELDGDAAPLYDMISGIMGGVRDTRDAAIRAAEDAEAAKA